MQEHVAEVDPLFWGNACRIPNRHAMRSVGDQLMRLNNFVARQLFNTGSHGGQLGPVASSLAPGPGSGWRIFNNHRMTQRPGVEFFEGLIKDQEDNELPNSSSGSFFTGLTDIDGLLSAMNFEEYNKETGEDLYTDEEYTSAQKYHTDKINQLDWTKY